MSELTKKDFDAKAMQIQVEISTKLSEVVDLRGNPNIPAEMVNDVFRQAIRYYLEWAYKEGLGVGKKESGIILQ